VVTEAELLAAVGEAFVETGRRCTPWPDPHAGRSPGDDEYSRVTDPARWHIVGARADAWLRAFAATGLATVERDVAVDWREPPPTTVTRADRAVPHAAGALPLVVARSRIEGDDDAGVTIGVAAPALCIGWVPHCGCDACDGGSQAELDRLDELLQAVVRGTYRRLSNGTRSVTVERRDGWWSGDVAAEDVPALLAAPGPGWDEVSGAAWFGEAGTAGA
jgi:hypothetical protein